MNIRTLTAGVALVAVLLPFRAVALDAPKGDVVLTITAVALDHPNIDGTAQFDMAMLEALAGRTGEMETPWTEGKVKFSGPFLRAILEAAGAHGTKLKVVALNDYAAELPIEDVTTIDTILATRMDGELMSVRDKGPLFLIYPFDKDSDLFNEKYFSRSVWQIKSIEVSK
ncbi:molybdopterin-dependent oxidoreductase [Rhizobium sp. 32-5/1]|uniref:molybdopterin-dependent oxidoreductase n=1 Tax=Rhizobium sp. 32-5/1 TaxID=3019602 RepID=UPI00240DD3DD|nr:molybdopterin-dependent oxidoreductase [Rhizobium sp. 32-5/1]WEZ84933.1 molybdopterin-dependent oxidoreductase [Rhizobium sp. 32-5/1]